MVSAFATSIRTACSTPSEDSRLPTRRARRRPARPDDAGGEGRHAVPRRDRHEPGRQPGRGHELLWPDAHLRADPGAAPEPLQRLLGGRAAADGRVVQPAPGAGRGLAPGHPRHDLVRPAPLLLHNPATNLFAGKSRCGPSRWALARSATPRWSRRLARSPGRSTWPSASAWPCTRWPTWPPSRAGGAATAPSARMPRFCAADRRLYPRLPGPGAGAAQHRLYDQALPRRRPAEGWRGPALPLWQGADLPRRQLRLPPDPVRGGLCRRHRADHALLRHADRAADRAGRLRVQQRCDHRAAAREVRLRRRGLRRLGPADDQAAVATT